MLKIWPTSTAAYTETGGSILASLLLVAVLNGGLEQEFNSNDILLRARPEFS